MKILVIDIETAGTGNNINYSQDLIVEVGIVGLDLETGERKIIYDTLVNQGITEAHKDSWVFKNTDIKIEDVMKAPPLDTKYIQYLLDNYPATAYNKQFDFTIFKNNGLTVNELDCPMLLSTNICKIPHRNGRGGYKWPKAEEAYNFFCRDGEKDENWIELHRAADDAYHEAEIVHKLYKNGIFKV